MGWCISHYWFDNLSIFEVKECRFLGSMSFPSLVRDFESEVIDCYFLPDHWFKHFSLERVTGLSYCIACIACNS